MSLADQGPPRLIHNLDVRSLPLSPEEAFVLSRVDGSTPAAEIAAATGLPEQRVERCLVHLQELGVIRFGPNSEAAQGSAPWIPNGNEERPQRTTSSVRLKPAVEETSRSITPHPAARAYDPALLTEDADLDLERKKLILDHYYVLDQLTHYSILQVSERASKEEIKQAYYDRVGLFHPDRYFGKDLGSFKPKLEKVFGALTKAYDTLVRKRSREEYDRYLAARRRTAGLSGSIPPVRLTPWPSPSPSAAPAPPPVSPTVSPADPDGMRRALARKLRGSRPSIPPPPKAPALDAEAMAQVASEDLKNLHAKRRVDTSTARVARYRAMAEESIAARQFSSAVNALKVALSVAPEDPALAQLLAATQEQADVAHADQFLERARYEEKDGRFLQAAQSYERAARGKKSAVLYDRAALCLIQAGIDAKRAVELARRAVELDSGRGTYRLTLARAYHLGNLTTSASLEIKRAAELAPDNEEIKTWSKRLK